jgi:hypothetical protein
VWHRNAHLMCIYSSIRRHNEAACGVDGSKSGLWLPSFGGAPPRSLDGSRSGETVLRRENAPRGIPALQSDFKSSAVAPESR